MSSGVVAVGTHTDKLGALTLGDYLAIVFTGDFNLCEINWDEWHGVNPEHR